MPNRETIAAGAWLAGACTFVAFAIGKSALAEWFEPLGVAVMFWLFVCLATACAFMAVRTYFVALGRQEALQAIATPSVGGNLPSNPRSIAPEQKAILMRRLAPLLKQMREVNGVGIQIVVNAINGWDSADYARQFVDLFRSLGFNIGNFQHIQSTNMGEGHDDLQYGACYTGLTILWDPAWWAQDDRHPRFGDDLASAMHEAGIDVRVVTEKGVYPVELIICARKV